MCVTMNVISFVCVCVYAYFNRKFSDSDVLHIGLPGFWTLFTVLCSKKHSFSKIEIFHSQVKAWGGTYSTGWKINGVVGREVRGILRMALCVWLKWEGASPPFYLRTETSLFLFIFLFFNVIQWTVFRNKKKIYIY